jgi:O-antigen/teichoic acid export membrane protein
MSDSQPSRRHIFLRGLGASAFAQVVSIAIGILSVPIGLGYFGSSKYGIWLVIGSVLAYLQLSPAGTTTATAVLIAKEAGDPRRRLIITVALRWLRGVSLSLIALILLALMFEHVWSPIFGPISAPLQHEAVWASAVAVLFYALRLPTLAYTAAFIGLQEVHLERLYAVLVPVILTFVALLLTIAMHGNLVMLAGFTGAAQLVGGTAAALHFHVAHRAIVKSGSPPSGPAPKVLASSSQFFIITLSSMVVWYTDNIVISAFLGPDEVTAYGVTFKLLTVGFMIFVLTISVLMPMFGDAISEGEWTWAAEVFEGSQSVMAVLGGLVWVGCLLFAWPVINLWTGPKGYGGLLVTFSLGAYGYLFSTINLNSTFLSSMNSTRIMVLAGITEALLNVALSLVFLHQWGIGGVALGTAVAALLTVFWLLPLDISRSTQSRVKVAWRFLGRHFVLAVAPAVAVSTYLAMRPIGPWIWLVGSITCAAYLVVSWLALSRTTRVLVLRLMPAFRHTPARTPL